MLLSSLVLCLLSQLLLVHAARHSCGSPWIPIRNISKKKPPTPPPVIRDGCGSSRVFTRDPTNNGTFSCRRLLQQEHCAENHWITINRHTNQGECTRQVCANGLVFIVENQLCHDPTDPSLCPEGMSAYQSAYGDVSCSCAATYFPDKTGACRRLFSQCSLPGHKGLLGQFISPDKNGVVRCEATQCPAHTPVPYNNRCLRFNQPCRGTSTVLVLDTITQKMKCINKLDFLLDRAPQSKASKHKLQLGYLPPGPSRDDDNNLTMPRQLLLAVAEGQLGHNHTASKQYQPTSTSHQRTLRRSTRSIVGYTPLKPCTPQASKCRMFVVPDSPGQKRTQKPNFSCKKGKILKANGKCAVVSALG